MTIINPKPAFRIHNAKYNWTVLQSYRIFTSWIGLKLAKVRKFSKGNQGSDIINQNGNFSLLDQNAEA